MSKPPAKSTVHAKPPPADETRLSVQALCRGELTVRVTAVTAAVARPAPPHVALRYGRVLLYLEDRAALDALADAVTRALHLGDQVFGPATDLFTEAEAADRTYCARTGHYPNKGRVTPFPV
jgi:hypothetical protein